MQSKNSCLIIVDVQNDFCEGGSLGVPEGNKIIPIINKIRESNSFGLTVLTSDFHNLDHISFADNNKDAKVFTTIKLLNGKYQEMWPVHCVKYTSGADFHKDLIRKDEDIIIRKGTLSDIDSYSGFGNEVEDTGLNKILKNNSIQKTFIVGLALDYCVQKTAFDSIKNGYETFVIIDAVKGISQERCYEIFGEFQSKGIYAIESQDIPNYI